MFKMTRLTFISFVVAYLNSFTFKRSFINNIDGTVNEAPKEHEVKSVLVLNKTDV